MLVKSFTSPNFCDQDKIPSLFNEQIIKTLSRGSYMKKKKFSTKKLSIILIITYSINNNVAGEKLHWRGNFTIVPMFHHFLRTKLVQERYILNYFIKKKGLTSWQYLTQWLLNVNLKLIPKTIEGCSRNPKRGSFSDPETNRSMYPRVMEPRLLPKNGKQFST